MGGGEVKETKIQQKLTYETVDKVGNLGYRLFFVYKGKKISPWHDIPLKNNDGTVNMICEIPKWSRAKYEISTREMLNPIRQDVKNGKLRFYQYGDMCFNYGALPQTWENPNFITKETNCPGDNDPIDILEIGYRQFKTGEVVPVKILGVLALIDDNETDWKLISISKEDPLVNQLDNIEDVLQKVPGCIEAIREYFKMYKVGSGTNKKDPNKFGFNGEPKGRDYALKVIEETHHFWKRLREENKTVVFTPLPGREFSWDSVNI